MVFSDLFFLFVFIPLFVLFYFLANFADKKSDKGLDINKFKFRNATLVVFSLLFYAWGEPIYVFLMLFCVLINFLSGRYISKSQNRKRALVLGLSTNILILAVFKYAGFFAESLQSIGLPIPVPSIKLPIGISFYIFQSISYLVDVYRKDSKAQERFVDLLLYISMFPQLIAGPIVRYNTVAQEINDRKVTSDDIAAGVYRFMIGLCKKVVIANQLGSIADQFMMTELPHLSFFGAAIGLLAFTLQIYFDFSGYSDMAIGIGRCLGFHFNENFNHPYCCSSVTDFWRRWHMSLGSFFRDYVYIPMGGNRNNQWRNVLCVWFLTGMWHGASWNFIIWGLYFGILLVLEKKFLLNIYKKIPFLGHVVSLWLAYVGWGIFYFDDFSKMKQFFRAFFMGESNYMGSTEASDFIASQAITDNFWLWIIAIILCLPIREKFGKWENKTILLDEWYNSPVARNNVRIIISLVILFVSVSLLVGATNNAFLYFRF